jgi:hypothetical protein
MLGFLLLPPRARTLHALLDNVAVALPHWSSLSGTRAGASVAKIAELSKPESARTSNGRPDTAWAGVRRQGCGKHGLAKDGLIPRQFMPGVVQTAKDLPLYHEVFDGNASETKTLLPTLTTILASVRRLILVADRGLLSLDNLEALQAIKLGSGQPFEFIIAVPGRRYHDFVALLGDKPFARTRAGATASNSASSYSPERRHLGDGGVFH